MIFGIMETVACGLWLVASVVRLKLVMPLDWLFFLLHDGIGILVNIFIRLHRPFNDAPPKSIRQFVPIDFTKMNVNLSWTWIRELNVGIGSLRGINSSKSWLQP